MQVESVQEFNSDGLAFAIIRDSAGTYLATSKNPDMIPLVDNKAPVPRKKQTPESNSHLAWLSHNRRCALLQSRTSMLT